MDTHDTDPLRRLRDADPARGEHPDLGQIRAGVNDRISGGGTADAVTWEGRGIGRAGRGTALVAAAAAAALAVGVGGYALGQSHGSGAATSVAASSEEAEDEDVSAGTEDPSGEQSEEAADLLGVGDSAMGRSEGRMAGGGWATSGAEVFSSSDLSHAPYGPVRLVPGEGLSTEGGRAEVFSQRGADLDPDTVLEETADRMGLTGWEIAGDDYSRMLIADGHRLYASDDPSSFTLSYENPYRAYGCAQTAEEQATMDAQELDLFSTPAIDPARCLPDPTEELTQDQAMEIAHQLVTDLGFDPEALELQVEAAGMPEGYGTASGDTEDGMRVTMDFSLRAEGVTWASYQLAQKVPLGDYPVISPAQAAERYNDPLLGRLTVSPDSMTEEGWAVAEEGMAFDPPEGIEPGEPVPVPGRVSTAVSAELTTGSLFDDMGYSVYTVPIYLITTDDDQQLAVLALAEEALQLQE